MSDVKWIPWKGTFAIENETVHLKANDRPEIENLSCELKDVLIDGNSLKIRVGAIISGLACKMSIEDKQNSSELDLKKTISELTDRVSMIESISADRITELEKVVIELEERISKLEWKNNNFY